MALQPMQITEKELMCEISRHSPSYCRCDGFYV